MCSFFILTTFFLVGCNYKIRPNDSLLNSQYRSALKRWSRETQFYNGLDLQLSVAATFKSRQFRDAYIAEYARTYQLNALETKQLEAEQEKAARRFYEFLIATFVPNQKLDDFEKADSVWRMYLTVSAESRIKPVEVRKMKYSDPEIDHFFPYVNPWKSVYLVRFPAALQTSDKNGLETSLSLNITGVGGSANMVWKKRP